MNVLQISMWTLFGNETVPQIDATFSELQMRCN